jgi:DNA modification methylase
LDYDSKEKQLRNRKSGDYGNGAGRNDGDNHPSGGWTDLEYRNKRSVWTVNSQPYADAHFATYPPDLIKPCILAGSKPGDIILDPFAGSGTTGMVSLELGRKVTLIELNPEYVKLIEQRCNTTPGLALT